MTSDCSYLNNMSNDMAGGMGLVISNWGGDATWLWHDRCTGSCNNPQLTISNIKITSGHVKPPAPTPPSPAHYIFGNACANLSDGYCPEMHCPSVDHCKWSWPSDDPAQWDSKDAACRCDI